MLDQKTYIRLQDLPVLLVDDYEPSATIMKLAFDSLDCHCDVASSAAEALQRFTGKNYGLVLVDIHLRPVNGFALTRHIRDFERVSRRNPAIIIGMTAGDAEEELGLCKQAGMNNSMTKSTLPDFLMNEWAQAAG